MKKGIHHSNPKEKKIMGTPQLCVCVVGSAEYSRCEGHAVYLVEPGRCETERNHHWGMVSTSIDTIEPSIARKTVIIRAEVRKSDSTA
ncbi:hypothetical protein Trydic_g19127 [Trypoxylus dichotomus]